MTDRVERVRRHNEECIEPGTMLLAAQRCVFCTLTTVDAGMRLVGEWVHVRCIESYIAYLKKNLDTALADRDQMKNQRDQLMTQWQAPYVSIPYINSGGSTVVGTPTIVYGSTAVNPAPAWWWSSTSSASSTSSTSGGGRGS